MTSCTTWRRCSLSTAVIAIACAAVSPAIAQKYPAQTVRVIVPTSPGGAVDAFGRGVGRVVQQSFGVTTIVDNRAGANGAIGAEMVSKAPPDGSTLLVIWGGHVINPLITKGVPFDPIRDFTPITRIGNIPLILVVHPSLPAKSVKELVALARAKPGMLTFASGGVGSGGHLSGELLKYMSKVDMLHIPYKGNSVALADVLGGHVTLMFDTITTGIPHTQKGKLRLLAVTSAERAPQAPDAPTMQESGFPGYETDAWYALLAPPKLSPAVQQQLNAELNKAFKDPAFREQFVAQGVRFVGGTPEQLEAHMRAESERWSKVFGAMGVRPQ
ncbi:MAG TPA: tripartite tricarboxylate transporter substrate binding protein [Burkholderiales bacterium]|nr:tripartite tricarboxylate transporter substrate binding protein [Burkholderiales bacterium]